MFQLKHFHRFKADKGCKCASLLILLEALWHQSVCANQPKMILLVCSLFVLVCFHTTQKQKGKESIVCVCDGRAKKTQKKLFHPSVRKTATGNVNKPSGYRDHVYNPSGTKNKEPGQNKWFRNYITWCTLYCLLLLISSLQILQGSVTFDLHFDSFHWCQNWTLFTWTLLNGAVLHQRWASTPPLRNSWNKLLLTLGFKWVLIEVQIVSMESRILARSGIKAGEKQDRDAWLNIDFRVLFQLHHGRSSLFLRPHRIKNVHVRCTLAIGLRGTVGEILATKPFTKFFFYAKLGCGAQLPEREASV